MTQTSPDTTSATLVNRRTRLPIWLVRTLVFGVVALLVRQSLRPLQPIWSINVDPDQLQLIASTPDGKHFWTAERMHNQTRVQFSKRNLSNASVAQEFAIDLGDIEAWGIHLNEQCDTIACRTGKDNVAGPIRLFDAQGKGKTFPLPGEDWHFQFSPSFRYVLGDRVGIDSDDLVLFDRVNGDEIAQFTIEEFDGKQMRPRGFTFNPNELRLAVAYAPFQPDQDRYHNVIVIYDINERRQLSVNRCAKPGLCGPYVWCGNKLYASRNVLSVQQEPVSIDHISYDVSSDGTLINEQLVYTNYMRPRFHDEQTEESRQLRYLNGPWALKLDGIHRPAKKSNTEMDAWSNWLFRHGSYQLRIVNLESNQQLVKFDQYLGFDLHVSSDGTYLMAPKIAPVLPPLLKRWFPHQPGFVCYQVDHATQSRHFYWQIGCGTIAMLACVTWLVWETRARQAKRT